MPPILSDDACIFFSLVHVCSVHEVLTRCQISQGAFGNGETLAEVRVSFSDVASLKFLRPCHFAKVGRWSQNHLSSLSG